MPLLAHRLCVLLGLCALSLPSSGASAAEGSKVFRYQNPISAGFDPNGVRDCMVFRDGDRWYLTATAWPHWPRQEAFGILNPGVVLYSSADLLQWKFEKVIVPVPGPESWYRRRFWAPEIHRIGGKYYATFNASNPDHGWPGQHFGYAVADSLLGPYRVVTAEKPLGNGNDFTLFQDDDGQVWAFWNRGNEFGIGGAPIDLAAGKLLAEPVSAIVPGRLDYAVDSAGRPVMEPAYDGRPARKIQKCHEWDSIGIEGAFLVKRQGTYYLFYSSWTRGYEIGYATAKKLTGPWTKHPGNPIYGAQSEAACKRVDIAYTGDPATPFNQVGHNEIFTGPDGRLWLSCHGILKSKPDQPMLVIDPIDFLPDGTVRAHGPTFTPQTIPLPALR